MSDPPAGLCECALRRARIELLAAAQARLLRGDQTMGALRWALRRQHHAQVSLAKEVRAGLAELVRGSVGLELLESRLPPQPDLASALQALSALHRGRLKLLGELAEALRMADIASLTYIEALDQDRRLRDAVDKMLSRVPPADAAEGCAAFGQSPCQA